MIPEFELFDLGQVAALHRLLAEFGPPAAPIRTPQFNECGALPERIIRTPLSLNPAVGVRNVRVSLDAGCALGR